MKNFFGTKELWPYLLALALIPAIYQTLALCLAAESPRYILHRYQDKERVYKLLSILYEEEEVPDIFKDVVDEIEDGNKLKDIKTRDIFEISSLSKPLMISCALTLSQRLASVISIMYYTLPTLKRDQIGETINVYSTMVFGIVHITSTCLSLFVVDYVGRRPLLLIGFSGMTLCTIALFFSLNYVNVSVNAIYIYLLFNYLHAMFYSIGPGPSPFILVPELFNTAVRPIIMSIAVPIQWIFIFFISAGYLPIIALLGPGVFFIFNTCQVLSCIFVLIFIPETKQMPVQEITALFK